MVSTEILLSGHYPNGLHPNPPEVNRKMLMLFILYWIKSYFSYDRDYFHISGMYLDSIDLYVNLYLLKYLKSVNK